MRFVVIAATLLLTGCASSAAPHSTSTNSPSNLFTQNANTTPVTKTLRDLNVKVTLPDTIADRVTTLRLEADVQADVTEFTSCGTAVVASYLGTDQTPYPVGMYYICKGAVTLANAQTITDGSSRIVFKGAVEKPFGLSTEEQQQYDELLAQLSNTANYS